MSTLPAWNHIREYDEFKDNLYWALRTRVLTDIELAQVREFGYQLTLTCGSCFKESEKIQEFNQALFHQAQLRILAQTKL